MNPIICLDTGIITLYYAKDIDEKINSLIEKIKGSIHSAFTINLVLIESYFHLCKDFGKSYAESCLINFQARIPITIIIPSRSLDFRAGSLKCKYRHLLSYTDCILIALALQKDAVLHTTESFPKIPKLKSIKYNF